MAVTIRTRRLRVNKVLSRKELTVEIFHEGTFPLIQENPTYPKLNSKNSSPRNTDGIPKM